MSAPVMAMISLIRLPFGPMISPILSTGICFVMTRGAFGEVTSRGAGITFEHLCPRMYSRASLACFSASFRTSVGSPVTFVSSCSAVM